MSLPQGSFLRSGKVKDIYDAGKGRLIFLYTNRLSSHDVVLADTVPCKGEVLCRLSARCFSICEKMGIETNMIDVPEPNKMIVKKLSIVPVEVIERNYLYGSYWKRFQNCEVQLPNGTDPALAAKLRKPIVEFTTKFEAKDSPITEEQILSNQWLTPEELSEIKRTTLKLNDLMIKDAERAGFILSDFKLEFGRDIKGKIILADEAETPDTCRFWDASTYQLGKVQDSFDKQIVRDYLEKVKGWDKNQPAPGTVLTERILPEEVIRKTSLRYIEAYERLTGEKIAQKNSPQK